MIYAKGTSKDDEKVIERALKRYKQCVEAEAKYRPECLLDQKFVDLLDQWPEPIKKRRGKKVMLTVDHVGTIVHQVVNDIRQNKLAIKVRPRGNGADVRKAKARQAVIRSIENDSRTAAIYDFCAESAVKAGEGFFRVLTEVRDPVTKELDIKVKRIQNWCAVHLDPDRQEADGSDAMFGFIVDEVNKDTAAAEGVAVADWNSDAIGDTQRDWCEGEKVRIAEYFEINGEGKARTCTWYKLSGTKVLKTTPFPCRFVPIIEVVGEEMIVEGIRYRRGIVRRAKDAQVAYNIQTTAEAERTAQLPKGKWVGTAKQFEGVEHHWKGANISDSAFLPYKSDKDAPGAPQYHAPEGVPNSVINAKAGAREDIKATTGVFDDSLGKQSNAKSGKAIIARQREGDTANYHFTDNLSRAVEHLGRILEDMIPRVFDTKRIFQIIGDDGKETSVGMNMSEAEAQAAGLTDYIEDPNEGDYSVVVEAGPSYATKRQETADALLTVLDKMPIVGEVGPDLVIEALDVDKADDLAERLREKLGIQPKTGPDGKPTAPAPDPAMLQAMQEMQMQNAALQDQLAAATEAANDKMATERIKAETEIRKAEIDAAAEVKVAMIQDQASIRQAQPQPEGKTQGARAEAGMSPALAELLQGLMESVSELRAQVALLGNTASAPPGSGEPAPMPPMGSNPLEPIQ